MFWFYQKNLIMFTTGGIGPTHDDITAKSISKPLMQVDIKKKHKILEKYYGKKKFNDGRKKMARMPRGAKLIYNPSSAAPGFITKCSIFTWRTFNLKFNDWKLRNI